MATHDRWNGRELEILWQRRGRFTVFWRWMRQRRPDLASDPDRSWPMIMAQMPQDEAEALWAQFKLETSGD